MNAFSVNASCPGSGLGKKLLLVLLLSLVFAVSGVFAQQVNEKQLTEIPKSLASSLYDVKYDAKTGAYMYLEFSEKDNTSVVVTSKGRSQKFFGANSYSAYIDGSGNVYCTAYNLVNDSIYTYFLLKNGGIVATFDFINEFWAENNGTFYFSAKEKDKTYFVAMDMTSGAVTKSKGYDDIRFVNIRDNNFAGHGEPPAYPGFTADGKPYYVAVKDSQYFMVVGGAEQKHYKDIDFYNVISDKNGDPVYFASDEGSIYTEGAQVSLVQGSKEYRKFSYLYPPVLFDYSNTPIYVGGDKMNGNNYPQVVMKGNEEISRKFTAGISDLQYTPSGKLAFTGSSYTDSVTSASYIVIDGVDSRKHNSIFSLTFLNGDIPLYTETKGKKQFVAKGDEKISGAYDNIPYFKMSAGKLYYIGTNYVEGKDDQTYVHVGDDKFGPFQMLPSEDMAYDNLVVTNDAGNYAFTGTKIISKKDYTYESNVYTEKGKCGPFSMVDNLSIYNGKPLFAGYVDSKKETTATICRINYNMKDITKGYDIVTDYKLDTKTGVISFLGARNDSFYYVEIKL